MTTTAHNDAGAPSASDHSNPIIAVKLQIILRVSIISNCSLVLVNKEVTPMPIKAAPTNRASDGIISIKPNKGKIHQGAKNKGRAKSRSMRKWILNHCRRGGETGIISMK